MIELGQLTATPGALEALEQAEIDSATLLARHAIGDWGEVDRSGWAMNNDCAEQGTGALLSLYIVGSGSVWVWTEWHRRRTTILMPNEY